MFPLFLSNYRLYLQYIAYKYQKEKLFIADCKKEVNEVNSSDI